VLKTKPSKVEKELLRQHRKESGVELIRLKADAVLMWDNAMSDTGVADVSGRSERRVVLWRRDWNKRRMASIFSGHQSNVNAAKLTKDQQKQIKQVLTQPPSEYGIPKEFWDVPTLKEYMRVQFDVIYESPVSYYFLLHFSGLSFKYPDTFDRKRNEGLITERMQSIRAEIKPLLQNPDWEVFSVDEVRMDQEAIIRKAWLKKGRRTVVKVDRNKQSQSYFGLLSQKDYKCHLYEMEGMQNSETVLKVLKQFLQDNPNKKICIVWDNAPFHRSKKIKDELAKGGIMERIHLIAMPPYAPDENPIEKVWGATKRKISNVQRDTFQETKQAFSDYVASRKFRYSF